MKLRLVSEAKVHSESCYSTVVSDKEKCMHGMACNLFNLYYFDINNTLKLIIWNIDKTKQTKQWILNK